MKQPRAESSSTLEVARDARRLMVPIRRDILNLLQQLVRIDTVAVPPDGNEAPAQKILAKFLKSQGLDVELYDTGFLLKSRHPYVRRDRNYQGRPNLIARLPGTGGGKSLLFNGHIDTVPTGPNPWRDSPWSGKIRAGRLYGRGAWDMKSGLVAQFAVLLALRKAGLKLRGDLLAESVVDEEWAGGGGTLAGRLHGDKADAAIIGEGTNLEVVCATRGGYFFDLIARAGDAAAYFSKTEVISPAIPMGRILEWIDGWTQQRRQIKRGDAYADFADPAPVQILALEANRYDPNIPMSTPLEAKVRVYFQFLPHEDVPRIVTELRRSFDAFCRKDRFFRAHKPEWLPYVDPPLLGHELAEEHPWTQCLIASAGAVLKRKVVVSAAQYPCDAFLLQREFGIPTLLFGPVGAGAHNADENVKINSLMQTAETLLTAAFLWCS